MLPDDWVGHPLRKDYAEQEDYRGIGTTRASPLEAFKQMDLATASKAQGGPGVSAPVVPRNSRRSSRPKVG
jgi:NADH-quinone oxidoreductase subunit C